MKEERFYFEGLFYSNENEFRKAVDNYHSSQISPLSVERALQQVCKNIALNLFNHYEQKVDVCNSDLALLCEKAVVDFIKNFRKLLEEKKSNEPAT